jgi:dTMP kinase
VGHAVGDRGRDRVSERGTYVVIEGIDGTGKTELAARLVPPLLGRGHSISSFREPTDKFLRAEFQRLGKVDSFAAALCYTVDRALLRPVIERALEMGDLVIQDRSFYSTLAYQYPGLSPETWREVDRIEREVALEPDLVLYLDAPVEVAVKRVESQGQRDAFEDEPYLVKVKRKFEQMFQPPRWVRINANGTPDQTLEQAMNALLAIGL